MEWRIAGEPTSLLVPFQVAGQTVEPDAHTIRVTLRGNDGVALSGADRVIVEPQAVDFSGTLLPFADPEAINIALYDPYPGSTPDLGMENATGPTNGLVILSIPSSYAALASGRNFENRFLSVEFLVNGSHHRFEKTYRISEFVPMQATSTNVRGLIGADPVELPDEDIDLYGAYFWLVSTRGSFVTTALTSPTMAPIHVTKAIEAQAAIQTFASLPARLLASEKANETQFTRGSLNFEGLKQALQIQLESELALAQSALLGSVAIPNAPPMAFSTQTDVITNT